MVVGQFELNGWVAGVDCCRAPGVQAIVGSLRSTTATRRGRRQQFKLQGLGRKHWHSPLALQWHPRVNPRDDFGCIGRTLLWQVFPLANFAIFQFGREPAGERIFEAGAECQPLQRRAIIALRVAEKFNRFVFCHAVF